RAHRRVHQLADVPQRCGSLLGRRGLLGLLQRHLHRLVVEARSLRGASQGVLELRALLGREPVPERQQRLVCVAVALQLQRGEPELEPRVLRLGKERILEEQLVELLSRVHVVAQLEGEDASPVQRLLSGGGGRVGLPEAQVRLHLLRLGLAAGRRLHLGQRLVGVRVLADLPARLARRSAGEIGHRGLAGTGDDEQRREGAGRGTRVSHGSVLLSRLRPPRALPAAGQSTDRRWTPGRGLPRGAAAPWQSARERGAKGLASPSVRLSPGLRIGPYEVLAALGTGGMAEVYRARDTRLGRDIALKVVNETLVRDPDLLRRFEQEARVAGSLNHPNLVSVFDVGDHDGSPYLVTELLQGESLRAKLMRGRIPVLTALDWAAQMARGLAAAHARGIVHRDVKPDNLFVSADGQVKLLDFGIAKLSQGQPAGPHGLNEGTLQPDATAPGSVLGTPGYMSPEQVRGDPVDARTDLFAVGAVLYEMLTGQRAFPGATFVETGYAILHQDPPSFPTDLPRSVVQVVQRCLEKEAGRRFQSASDLAFALDVLRGPITAPAPALRTVPVKSRRARWIVALLALALCLAAAAVVAARSLRRSPAEPRVEQVSFRWGTVTGARFTPDGRVIFSAAFEGQPEELYS